MKYGFLFGAGAEIAYNLPSGGRFALDIFRQDTAFPKQKFKNMRDAVEPTTAYATEWLPRGYKDKNIGTFGKSVFQNIIMSTVEHRRGEIVKRINDFDAISISIAKKMEKSGENVNDAFLKLLGKDITNIRLSNVISYNDAFKKGNELFESNYFSGLLTVYKDFPDKKEHQALGRILLSIMQLQLGALSEDLSRNINDNLFEKKDDTIDLFDDFGELIQLNYNAAGVSGLEYLLEPHEMDCSTSYGIILTFSQQLMEEIYSSVLDYKSLIDSNWHYLYNPASDWAKFCKISIFLLTVHKYITDLGDKADKLNPDGYYNMLRSALNAGKYEASTIATTNYNKLIADILGNDYEITYLNGSVAVWYDPYLNKVGSERELDNDEHHIIVPLLFTQSGTKPMTSISMSKKYVDMYMDWRASDAVVVVGFGFGADDEHINGILRTLVNDDEKELYVVTLNRGLDESNEARQIARRLKVRDYNKIKVLLVDKQGKIDGVNWTERLEGEEL